MAMVSLHSDTTLTQTVICGLVFPVLCVSTITLSPSGTDLEKGSLMGKPGLNETVGVTAVFVRGGGRSGSFLSPSTQDSCPGKR